jgi:DNA repair photolyase
MKAMTTNSVANSYARNIANPYRAKHKKDIRGTQEWSVKDFNCVTGCLHNCKYCYARGIALDYNQIKKDEWPFERIRAKDVEIRHRKKYDGQIMFPSSHDITPNNLDACITKLRNLLIPGNRVLIVSKPHMECIEKICELLLDFKSQILFRFTIGACDDRILSYWEPNAPAYAERKQCLMYAYNAGFQTSVSVEPMLDSANIDALIGELLPYVTHSIWVGMLNHSARFGKVSDMVLQQAIEKIKRGQTNSNIKSIYRRYKDNPMIRYKAEIKKIVGIPLAEKPGMDI